MVCAVEVTVNWSPESQSHTFAGTNITPTPPKTWRMAMKE